MVQMLTEWKPRRTVVSVDGVGAFDLVSTLFRGMPCCRGLET